MQDVSCTRQSGPQGCPPWHAWPWIEALSNKQLIPQTFPEPQRVRTQELPPWVTTLQGESFWHERGEGAEVMCSWVTPRPLGRLPLSPDAPGEPANGIRGKKPSRLLPSLEDGPPPHGCMRHLQVTSQTAGTMIKPRVLIEDWLM